MFTKNSLRLVSYTSNVVEEDIELMHEKFFPSVVQRKIHKKADIRVVYLLGEFYCMAIFSQSNSKTTVDFRNYDNINPNRNVPFKLPSEIERRLKSFVGYVKLNFCSIDLLLDENNDFYFLEINPVGQFGMVSIPCNYHLEKKIGEWL